MAPPEKIEARLPFAGFYESIHMDQLERIMCVSDDDFYEAEKESPEAVKKLEEQRDSIDWQKEQIEYAKQYVKAISKILGIKLAFQSLESPRFYNYETDKIYCDIDLDTYNTIMDKAAPLYEKIVKKVQDQFTSRPGFLSNYSNDFFEWLNQEERLDHNQLCVIIEALLEAEEGDDWEYRTLELIQ